MLSIIVDESKEKITTVIKKIWWPIDNSLITTELYVYLSSTLNTASVRIAQEITKIVTLLFEI